MIFQKLKLKYTLQFEGVRDSVLEDIANFEEQLAQFNPEGYDKLFLVNKTISRKEINLPNYKSDIKYVISLNVLDACLGLNELIANINTQDIVIKNTINFSSRPYKRSLSSIISLMTDSANQLLIEEGIQQRVFRQETKNFLDEAMEIENKLIIQSA